MTVVMAMPRWIDGGLRARARMMELEVASRTGAVTTSPIVLPYGPPTPTTGLIKAPQAGRPRPMEVTATLDTSSRRAVEVASHNLEGMEVHHYCK